MSTILYNILQYCSVLYNMKYLIVMHWFSDGPGAMKTPNGDTRGTKSLLEERQMRRSFGWGAGDGGLALERNCKLLCGPRNRTFAALVCCFSFASRNTQENSIIKTSEGRKCKDRPRKCKGFAPLPLPTPSPHTIWVCPPRAHLLARTALRVNLLCRIADSLRYVTTLLNSNHHEAVATRPGSRSADSDLQLAVDNSFGGPWASKTLQFVHSKSLFHFPIPHNDQIHFSCPPWKGNKMYNSLQGYTILSNMIQSQHNIVQDF